MSAGDTAWVLVCAALVLFMTPGLALFYGGMVRTKNVLAIIMQCFSTMGVVSVLWVVIGFSLAFGHDAWGGLIGGVGLAGLRHLWFGWFGFNAGSALGANAVASQALVNTQLAAATGLLGWILAERMKGGRATTLGAASGAVAGMVAITPCAGFVGALPALVIGFAAGVVCLLAVSAKFRLRYDDSLDVVAVHGVGGVVGMLLLGIFAARGIDAGGSNGLLSGGRLHLVGLQAMAVVATIGYAFVATWAVASAVDAVLGLRVAPDEEIEGLDTIQHAETAYSGGALGRLGQ